MPTEEEFEQFVSEIVSSLNDVVFSKLYHSLEAHPQLRETLNPAFPFPKKLRIGALDTHLVVEYVGPEDPDNENINIKARIIPGISVREFLGLDLEHLNAPTIPVPHNMENLQVFLGDAMNLLGDYLYDIVQNPRDVMLNGIPDFGTSDEPTYLSNVTYLWSDESGSLRIRHFDFVELFPIHEEGWAYHTDESYDHFANFLLLEHHVPRYVTQHHKDLNEFIELVGNRSTSEPEITKYLENHPAILQLAFGAHDLNPQTLLIWQDDEEKDNLQPDFLPVRMDSYADILEFKLPWMESSPIVGKQRRRKPSSEIDRALSQIDEYADWCQQNVNRAWLESKHGIKIHSPHTYLVIGHRSDFDAAERQKLRSRRNATIFTYDEFIEMARMQLYRLK